MLPNKLNKKTRKKYFVIFFGGLVFLFLAFFFFGGFPPAFLKSGFFFVSRPIIFLQSGISDFFEKNLVLFKSKQELQSENIFLKQSLEELKTKEELSGFFEEENKKLKEELQFSSKRNLLISSVLLRPGYGIYNSLVISSGINDGATNGMPVMAFGNVFLGHVFEAQSDMSRVKLISFPGEETNVFIGNKISAIAVGMGGENMQIILPHDIDIREGDVVTTIDTDPLFLGAVEKIEKDPADPFQKIIFRLPVNVQELRYVFVEKSEK